MVKVDIILELAKFGLFFHFCKKISASVNKKFICISPFQKEILTLHRICNFMCKLYNI